MLSFLEEIRWRGLLYQTTGEELEQYLSTSRVGYCGFDPTASSLTIGNFIAIKLLMHWQRAGHKPIVLIGGGTGLIGDPSGKDAERQLLTAEQVEENIVGQRKIFEKFLDFDLKSTNATIIVNNAEWLTKLGYIEVLRNIGKYFSVNAMIQKDSVRERLNNREQGISYTEFSYMILQAYDFYHLRREKNCTVQIAGSDQYGNIVAGIELIRRLSVDKSLRAFGVTTPLITDHNGKKIGKTEKGAIWLSTDRTSPYAFYQFWINVDDTDVISFLKWFTFLKQDEIVEISERHNANPHMREAQKILANHVTTLVHGESEMKKVKAASNSLFTGEVRQLDEKLLEDVIKDIPHSELDRSLLQNNKYSVVDLLVKHTSLVSSKREAREFLASGAITVNGERVDINCYVTEKDLLHGHTLLIKRGKKLWYAIRCK
jgi:tyrosyl-tRNA synthetase